GRRARARSRARPPPPRRPGWPARPAPAARAACSAPPTREMLTVLTKARASSAPRDALEPGERQVGVEHRGEMAQPEVEVVARGVGELARVRGDADAVLQVVVDDRVPAMRHPLGPPQPELALARLVMIRPGARDLDADVGQPLLAPHRRRALSAARLLQP